MKSFCAILTILYTLGLIQSSSSQCTNGQKLSFIRWSGVTPERTAPVFMYSASGEEQSLVGVCLSRCKELDDCAAVVVEYGKGSCQGMNTATGKLHFDNDVAYFSKICLKLPMECEHRWWALESTPSYYLQSTTAGETRLNVTEQQCYEALLAADNNTYRSAQWIVPERNFIMFETMTSNLGNCILIVENKFTEPESYRVTNSYTYYIENQCGHDYPQRIDRCSYEEYYNQTLKHIDFTTNNVTKDECKTACELEERFVCRGFTWGMRGVRGLRDVRGSRDGRGLCDLHSEDLVTSGSWLLRRNTDATYYRRVICLNISVECQDSSMLVTYRPRGVFRGRLYVPGRGEACGVRGEGAAPVRLTLPLSGDCDVNYAYAISNGPGGVVNRTMAYVMVMIQNNPIIQTAGDRWVRVGCSPGGARAYTNVDATVAVKDTGKPSQASESGASAVYASTAPLSMYVVRAQDTAPAPAVALGELLELRIETTAETEIEAYHLVASSRLGDSSVLLLDSRGCPTGQVDFPAFSRTWHGGTQRLTANFKAFRFPNSHVVRFALMVRFCQRKCKPVICGSQQIRTSRQTDLSKNWSNNTGMPAAVQEAVWWEAPRAGVVAQGGAPACVGAAPGRVPLELEMVVGSRDIISADTLVRADHQSAQSENESEKSLVCVHELLLVSLALTWLAVQILLLLGCCVLVKRYRNLAEMSMQKDYHSFDNLGFESSSTPRRVHWPDQTIDILHTT
ncbi:uncharacterized protein LOC106714136 [Papilio machaon]|uniref:uncharacterized protein LOC106714136 n=1 Tax=Papilio machaon TaxID=76193 RepID=UPI001E662B6B|nr:uncharacterized protein LOC106714136 [Papilio machaon]